MIAETGSASARWRTIRRGAFLLTTALLLTSLWDPALSRRVEGIDYLVVFDVSLSMATEDYAEAGSPESRLAIAKELFLSAIPDLPPQSRLSLAGFAGSTVQVFALSRPVDDREAVEAALSVLEWDNIWDVGSPIDRALRDIVAQAENSTVFSVTGRRRILPSPLNIVFFTDGGGSDAPRSVGADATEWLTRHARVTFVGVGQPRESFVPEFTRASVRDCLRDEKGRCLTSGLNEGALRDLADWLGGRYERLEDREQLVRLFGEDPLTGAAAELPRRIGWLFGLGSLLFFLVWLVL